MNKIKKLFFMLLLMAVLVGFTAFSSYAVRISYHETIKSDVPVWSSASTSSEKADVYAQKGTVLTVKGSTTTASGNKWYKLTDGNWVFSGHVTSHTHCYSSDGFCSSENCSYEWAYMVTPATGTYQVTVENGAGIFSRPYSTESKVYKIAAEGSFLKISGETYNVNGELWYGLTDGGWINSENVKKCVTVTFYANKGNNAPEAANVIKGKSLTLPVATPNRVGYVFQGWTTSSKSQEVVYNPGGTYSFSKNIKLYAVWKSCTHNYENNGGICNVCGYEYPLKITNVSADFIVYNDEGASLWTIPYSTGDSWHMGTMYWGSVIKVKAKTTNATGELWYRTEDGDWIYSKNIRRCYTISFDANGGYGAPWEERAIKNVELTLPSYTPEREGYLFNGWSTSLYSSSGEYKAGSAYKFTADTTLYATWKICPHKSHEGGYCNDCYMEIPLTLTEFNATYVVTNSSGATAYSRPYKTNSWSYTTYSNKTSLTVVAAVTNADKQKWYMLYDGSWVWAGDVTRRFTVKYNANSGKSAPKEQYFLTGKQITLTSKTPKRVGYIFQGWSASKSSAKVSYKPGSTYKFTKNTTLYAVWKACKHNYKGNGGICKNCEYEYPIKLIEQKGKIQVTNKNGATIRSRPYFENTKTIRTDKSGKVLDVVGKGKNQKGETWYKLTTGRWVYAKHVTVLHAVNYDANTGKNAPKTQYFLSGKSVTLTKNKPVLDGYIFLGWDTSYDAMTVVYKPGSKYSKKADVTLYAVWSENGKDPVGNIYIIRKSLEKTMQSIASTELGNGWWKYATWFYENYGGPNPEYGYFAWCDRFSSWAMNKAGIPFGVGGCQGQVYALGKNYYPASSGYKPETGDMVFLDYDKDNYADHVAFIYFEDGDMYLLHGNWADRVQLSIATGPTGIGDLTIDECIMGYGNTVPLLLKQRR